MVLSSGGSIYPNIIFQALYHGLEPGLLFEVDLTVFVARCRRRPYYAPLFFVGIGQLLLNCRLFAIVAGTSFLGVLLLSLPFASHELAR